MYKRIASLFSILALAALAVSCAPQTKTVKLYEDGSTRDAYQRLLVVDVANDQELRRAFENQIVSQLKRAGTSAVASHTVLKNSGDGLSQDDINQKSRELGADGILVSHMVSLETEVERGEGREEIVRTCRGGNPVDYFLYDDKVLKEPDSVKLALTVIVVSNLYDSANRDRIWSIQSTCFKKSDLSEVFIDESKAIVRQLQVDNLI